VKNNEFNVRYEQPSGSCTRKKLNLKRIEALGSVHHLSIYETQFKSILHIAHFFHDHCIVFYFLFFVNIYIFILMTKWHRYREDIDTIISNIYNIYTILNLKEFVFKKLQ
jgi:hypothetical protein